jgi:sugar/nucleoside kinase (ribokinase family)
MICVLGDAHLDVVALVSWPLAEETDTPAMSSISVGGQGANVAAWVAALGARSRLITARATDFGAGLVTDELGRLGVEVVGPEVPGRTGIVISLSDGGQRRSMLTDRGVGTKLAAAELSDVWLDGCRWLHIPAYSFASEPVRGAAMAAASAASARSVRLSIDLSSTAMVEAYGTASFRELIVALRPDVVFGNQAEAALIGDVVGERLIVKLGADGVRAAGRHYPAVPTVPVDSTGAGDAFAAGYLVGGITLGLQAAAQAMAKMGAMP